MAKQLPRFVVLNHFLYASFWNESGSDRGYISCTAESVYDPYVKIGVEHAKINDKYVHLRFSATNKYWAAKPSTEGDIWIQALSDQAEEDTSNQSCTLFEPVHEDLLIAFKHVQTGWVVAINDDNSRLYLDETDIRFFNFVDWETLVNLPKRVAFKGDIGKYVREYRPHTYRFLQVGSDDANEDITSFEVHPQPDGRIRIMSSYYQKYWTRDGSDWISPSTDDESGDDSNTLFHPYQIDESTIALRCAGNNNFVKRLTNKDCDDSLNAAATTITTAAKFQVQELVMKKSIYNTRYRMEDARIFDETPFVAGDGTAHNDTDTENALTVTVKFKETTSSTFTHSHSLKIGGSVEFTVGIPFVEEGTIKVSAEATNSLEWNKTKEETKSVEVAYAVKVPPRSTVRVSYIGTRGTCSVPFSYTQRATSSTDGEVGQTEHIDGIYTGVSCYNYQFDQPVINAM